MVESTPKIKFKITAPISIFFLILIAIFSFLSFKTLILPVFTIFTNRPTPVNQAPVVPLEALEELIIIRNLWDKQEFENFSLQMPEFEVIETNDENKKALLIKDSESGENITLNISREKTDIESLENIEPENESAGYTLLNEYDALRIGSSEAPYDTVTYYILKNNYLYKLDVKFSAPVAFLDQILSSFKIIEGE